MKTKNVCTFMISRSILLKMRNFSDKICKENQKTQSMFHDFYPKILLASSRGRLTEKIKDDNIIWCMCLACWITKATDINSEFLIRIAFKRQIWLRECAPLLRYTYITFPPLKVHFPIVLLFVTDLLEFCVLKN